MKYQRSILNYFECYSAKNIELLRDLFSPKVVLRDWNVHLMGKEKVIQGIMEIFTSINSILITPKSFFSNSDSTYAVLITIEINGVNSIDVIDVITFDERDKISEIFAYKQVDLLKK
jgi:hypothetical protein